ncbi:MAG TPA: hypothetical protein VK453_08330 [Micromonosporaceae bacterium]|nr:hypothetical protein [Micromonosporaceae bacterium]
MTAPLTSHPSPWTRISDALWVGLPLRVRRISAGLAVATVDGLYLAARPLIGLLAPIVAFVGGFVVGAFHPGFDIIFTEALWLLMLVAAIGAASGAVGLYLTVGFALGDLTLGDHPSRTYQSYVTSPVEAFAGQYGSLLLSYLLLAMLAVGVPIAAKSLAAEFMLPTSTPRALRAIVAIVTVIATTGLLVYVWLQSTPLLVRPVFVWTGTQPTVEAMAPAQQSGAWVITFAVLAGTARSVVQLTSAANMGGAGADPAAGTRLPGRMDELEARFRTAQPVVPLLSRLPLPARLVIRAAFLTLILSGLYAAYWHALLTFVVLLAAQFLAAFLGTRAPAGYARRMNRVPRLIRLLLVIVPVYLVGTLVMGYFLRRAPLSFLPFLILTILSAVLMSLLSPARPGPNGQQR